MTLLWAAALLGLLLGIAARAGHFCLLRGLRQALGRDASTPTGSAPALQAFALALALALLASQALQWAGLIDLANAQIARTRFSPWGVAAGGALFGVGMVLANACPARSLVLLAGGNLRSLITLVFVALGAQITMTGALAPLRQWFQNIAPMELAHSTAVHSLHAAGVAPLPAFALLALLPAAVLAGYALRAPALRRSPVQLVAAGAIGLLVAAGWWITATIDVDPFDPAKLTSLSLIGPVAEGVLYLQLAVGRDVTLGPVLALGVLLGALLVALATRTLRWEGFDGPAHLARSTAGGLLMGFGGVLAAGCSLGQGLSGLSALTWASGPAVLGIALGGLAALWAQPRCTQSVR